MTLSGLLDAVLPIPLWPRPSARPGSPRSTCPRRRRCGRWSPRRWPPTRDRGGAGRPVLAVTATGRDADDLVDALRCLLPADQVAAYPSWETLPHERLSPRADTVGRRLAVLRRLAHPSPTTRPPARSAWWSRPVRSVLQPQVPGPRRPGAGQLPRRRRGRAGRPGRAAGRRRLRPGRAGREARRVRRPRRHPRRLPAHRGAPGPGRVLGRRRRGGALLRRRRPALARRAGRARLWAPPCRELLLTPAVRERAKQLAAEHPELPRCSTSSPRASPVEGMESLAPGAGRRACGWCCTSCRAGTHVLVCDPERVRTRAHDLVRTARGVPAARPGRRRPAAAGADRPRRRGVAHCRARPAQTAGRAGASRGGRSRPFAASTRELDPTTRSTRRRDAAAERVPRGHRPGRRRRAASGPGTAGGSRWSSTGTARRSARPSSCSDAEVPVRGVPTLDAAPAPGYVTVATGRLAGGFVAPAARAGGAHRARPHRPARTVHEGHAADAVPARRNAVDPLAAAARRPRRARAARHRPVHRDGPPHGQRRRARVPDPRVRAGPRGQPGDRLFVPTDSLDQLTRYVGGEAPTLHKLGGADWQKTKGRARKAVKEIAGELIRLYAARHGAPRATRSARTRRGSASSRTPSRTRRRPTSSAPSTRSRPTWSSRSRWTG